MYKLWAHTLCPEVVAQVQLWNLCFDLTVRFPMYKLPSFVLFSLRGVQGIGRGWALAPNQSQSFPPPKKKHKRWHTGTGPLDKRLGLSSQSKAKLPPPNVQTAVEMFKIKLFRSVSMYQHGTLLNWFSSLWPRSCIRKADPDSMSFSCYFRRVPVWRFCVQFNCGWENCFSSLQNHGWKRMVLIKGTIGL